MKYLHFLLILVGLMLAGCESPLLTHDEAAAQKPVHELPQNWLKGINRSLSVEWIAGPYGNPTLESSLILTFKNEAGELESLPPEITINHFGWMPSMGHGTADDGYLSETGTGELTLYELYFSMGGDWTLSFEFMKAGEKIAEITFDLYL